MSAGQIAAFWILTLTTGLGGLIYLGYLGIIYRMDRDSPVAGPRILAREAAIAEETRERREFFLRMIKNPLVWGPIVSFLIVRAIMVHS